MEVSIKIKTRAQEETFMRNKVLNMQTEKHPSEIGMNNYKLSRRRVQESWLKVREWPVLSMRTENIFMWIEWEEWLLAVQETFIRALNKFKRIGFRATDNETEYAMHLVSKSKKALGYDWCQSLIVAVPT